MLGQAGKGIDHVPTAIAFGAMVKFRSFPAPMVTAY